MEGFGNLGLASFHFKFKWEIGNFCLGCLKNRDLIRSPKIFKNNIHWFLGLHITNTISKRLSAETGELKDYIPLRLYSSVEIKAVKNIKIFGDNDALLVDETIDDTVKTDVIYTLDGSDHYGSTIAVSRESILNSVNRTLNHEKYTIVCEITCNDNELTKQHEDSVLPRLEDDNRALLEDHRFSDVSLVSEGKIVKAHKCILANKSSVFAAMFDADMIEKQNSTVEITDIKYDVLVEMIRFIYTRKVDNLNALLGELAIAADKYALDDLKITCEETMKRNLKLGNLIESLELADKLRMDRLTEKIIEFVVRNASEIIDKAEFALLPDDIVRRAFTLSNRTEQKC